jgi:hypothetical protein
MKRKSKAGQFTAIAESIGILGTDAADKTVGEILESFVRGADGDRDLAKERIQEYLDKLSPQADPLYVSKVRRAKLRLE